MLNISGYKFIHLPHLASLHAYFAEQCHALDLKGTVLLSHEGVNINLAGDLANISTFLNDIKQDQRFCNISFKKSFSRELPFKRLKIKIKKEIITFKQSDINPAQSTAPTLSPQTLKSWLDTKYDFTLLDMRNEYEVRFGTFIGAETLFLTHFSQLTAKIKQLKDNKPIVTFCTGGIRCEKAALYMLNQGVTQVYQLQGGILNYFEQIGGDHFRGECFVFDDRIAINSQLQSTGTKQCQQCQGPIIHHSAAKTSCECLMRARHSLT